MDKINIAPLPAINLKNKINKRGGLLNKIIVEIILVVLVFGAFLMVTADKVNARGVRQQVVEGELALLIESAVPGMSFSVWKVDINGVINDIRIKNSRIFVSLEGLNSLNGRPFFSKYSVSVSEEDNKFVVSVS